MYTTLAQYMNYVNQFSIKMYSERIKVMARKHVEPIQVHVPEGAAAKIQAFAKSLDMEMSDYIRRVVETDMRAHGQDISLEVRRGAKPKP